MIEEAKMAEGGGGAVGSRSIMLETTTTTTTKTPSLTVSKMFSVESVIK